MKTSPHLFGKMACVFLTFVAVVSCKKAEIYSTTVNELQKLSKSKSISVPFDETAVDTFAFRKEMAASLKAFIRQNKRIAPTEKQAVHAENLSMDSSLRVVYPEPTIDVHVPDLQNIPFGFGTPSWSETITHEWEVATLYWGFDVAKIYSVENIELTGWFTDEFKTDSLDFDVIVYNIDRVPHAGSYTDRPVWLDWEETLHWTTYTNSLLQGIAHFNIKGYAEKKFQMFSKQLVEKGKFWSSDVIYIPKQPK